MTVRPAVIRRLAGAALMTVVVATPAAAAPVPLTGQRTIDPMPVGLAFDDSGRAVASWRTVRRQARRGRAPSPLRRDGSRRQLAPAGDAARIRPRARSRGQWSPCCVRDPPAGAGRPEHTRSMIRLLVIDTASGSIRRVQTLAAGPPQRVDPEGTPATLSQPRVAATPDGDLVVAWVRSTSRKASGVWATTMHPNGRLRRLRAGGRWVRYHRGLLSIADDGRGLLAWQRPHGIQARVRRASGSWGGIEFAATTILAVTWGVDAIDASAADGRQFAVGVLQTARSMAGVRVYTTVHVRNANGVWRSAVAGDFMFTPDLDTSYVTDLPRVLTFATGDRRLHAAWPALAGGHAGAMAATLAAAADAFELTTPLTLSARHHERGARGRRARAGRLVRRGLVGRRRARPDRGGRHRNAAGQHGPRHREAPALCEGRDRSGLSAACSWCGAKEPRRPATGRSHGRSEGMSTATETRLAVPSAARNNIAGRPTGQRTAPRRGGSGGRHCGRGAFLVPVPSRLPTSSGFSATSTTRFTQPRSLACSVAWARDTPPAAARDAGEKVAARRSGCGIVFAAISAVHRNPGRRRSRPPRRHRVHRRHRLARHRLRRGRRPAAVRRSPSLLGLSPRCATAWACVGEPADSSPSGPWRLRRRWR